MSTRVTGWLEPSPRGAMVLALLLGAIVATSGDPITPRHDADYHKGVCFAAWSSPRAWLRSDSDEALRAVADLGANWVSLRITWFQDRFDSPLVRPDSASPDDDAIAHAVGLAHSLGMKVMLVLVVDLVDDSGGDGSPGEKWRGMIQFPDEAGWQAWFSSYEAFCCRYAAMAEDLGADMLCLGAELTIPATTREGRWRSLIARCRGLYSGPLTYQANFSPLTYSIDTASGLAASGQWRGEYRAVGFWDALDYACICAYFPLTRDPGPSLEQLRHAWEPWLHDLRSWASGVGRPVLFGEIGYHSAQGAARQPWAHRIAGEVAWDLQADCFRAFLDTFSGEPWVAGVYWWLAHPSEETGLDPEGKGFPFMGKPAEEVVRRSYALPRRR